MKIFRKTKVVCISLMLATLLFGCNQADDTSGEGGGAAAAPDSAQQTHTVRDAKGEVVIPANPKRIADVSGSTEELLVLGFQPVLTGNTDMGNPAEVTPLLKRELKGKVAVGGWFQTDVNIEAIMEANPDLILAGPTQEKIVEQLSKIAPTVRVPHGFNAFRERFAFVAGTLGKTKEMETWLAEYEQQALQQQKRITAVTKDETFAVIEATQKEIRIYARTGIADLVYSDLKLPKAPGIPDPDPWGGKVTSLEGLSTLNPDHLVLLTDSSENVLEKSSIWNGLKAVKADNVYRMTSRQNYNEAFFALGKQALLNQLAEDIAKPKK
ncbi:MAG: transporter substrate-binding protein [Paenibacillus sp.]|nr:transporter substrate-binding protein [Paenibacillus sp.]